MPIRTCATALLMLLVATAAGTALATGTVQGFVTAQDTNQALAGVAIRVDSDCLGANGAFCFSTSAATSANDGSFTAAGVVAGSAYVSAAFTTPSQYISIYLQQVIVSDGNTTPVNLVMQLGAKLSGVVTRASDGAPVAGVPIRVVTLDHQSEFDATTDASGVYTIEPVPAGSYTVSTLGASPYQGQFYAGHTLTAPSQNNQGFDSIAIASGQIVAGINLSMVEGGHIRGTLTDRYTGLPFAGANDFYFNVFDKGNPNNGPWLYFKSSTDAQGNYEITGLPDAPIYLGTSYYAPYLSSIFGCAPDPCDFSNATTLNAPAGTTLTNIDISIFPDAVITGTVTRRSDGAPVPNATVTGYGSLFGSPATASVTQTDAQGHYTLTGCELCSFVEVSHAFIGGAAYIGQDYNNHNCQQGKCATLSANVVAPPEYTVVTGIDFHLDAGAVITGQMVRGDTGTGLHAYVDLYSSGGFASAVSSAPDGQFVTPALQPGTYYLVASPDYASGYDCAIYSNVLCGQGIDPTLVGQPIVVSGTNDVTGIVLGLPSDTLFKSGFE